MNREKLEKKLEKGDQGEEIVIEGQTLISRCRMFTSILIRPMPERRPLGAETPNPTLYQELRNFNRNINRSSIFKKNSSALNTVVMEYVSEEEAQIELRTARSSPKKKPLTMPLEPARKKAEPLRFVAPQKPISGLDPALFEDPKLNLL
jgi:hypothetical protein